MRRTRYPVVTVLLIIAALYPPTAAANCQGVICGGQCNYEGLDFCVYVWGGNETIGCKNVDGAGCMSMVSPVCCPRDPMG
jgi:hypothetical protein